MNRCISAWLIVGVVFLNSCIRTPDRIYHKTADYTVNVKKQEYVRDSLYLGYTVLKFIDFQFANYSSLSKPVVVVVDSIFYSPDKLKLFAFCIVRDTNNTNWGLINRPKNKYFYNGRNLIAYRSDINAVWDVHNFDQYTPVRWDTYKEVYNLFRFYYYNQFKDDMGSQWDSTINNLVSVKFDYNLNEKAFWDKSLVWRKGALIPGYYNFQLDGNVRASDPSPVIVRPTIVYPDSILRLYGK
jgi:hypothetical protein